MPLCRSPLTLRLALFSRSRTAAVEIPRFILHRRRSEFLPLHRGAEKRAPIAFVSVYTAVLRRRRALSLPQSSPYLKIKRLDSFAPSPFSARASAIRSCTCGRQRLAFLAASATGGARKPNPSEGAEAAPPPRRETACQVFLRKKIANFLAKNKTSSQICVLTC